MAHKSNEIRVLCWGYCKFYHCNLCVSELGPCRGSPTELGFHFYSAGGSSSDDEDDDDDDDSDLDNDVAHGWVAELTRKQQHPERLHEELWFNEPGEVCNPSVKL